MTRVRSERTRGEIDGRGRERGLEPGIALVRAKDARVRPDRSEGGKGRGEEKEQDRGAQGIVPRELRDAGAQPAAAHPPHLLARALQRSTEVEQRTSREKLALGAIEPFGRAAVDAHR